MGRACGYDGLAERDLGGYRGGPEAGGILEKFHVGLEHAYVGGRVAAHHLGAGDLAVEEGDGGPLDLVHGVEAGEDVAVAVGGSGGFEEEAGMREGYGILGELAVHYLLGDGLDEDEGGGDALARPGDLVFHYLVDDGGDVHLAALGLAHEAVYLAGDVLPFGGVLLEVEVVLGRLEGDGSGVADDDEEGEEGEGHVHPEDGGEAEELGGLHHLGPEGDRPGAPGRRLGLSDTCSACRHGSPAYWNMMGM